jgi:ribosomal-protein-alanine N-acetyltransferase
MASRIGVRGQEPVVREARPADLDAIENIENTVFDGDRLSRRSLRYFLTAKTSLLLVLVADKCVAGYSLVAFRKGSFRARLYSVALDPAKQGRGLGRFLLGASEQAASARGALVMRLEVRTDNAVAIALYEKSGYRNFAAIDDYYEDGGSALRFEKELNLRSGASRGRRVIRPASA